MFLTNLPFSAGAHTVAQDQTISWRVPWGSRDPGLFLPVLNGPISSLDACIISKVCVKVSRNRKSRCFYSAEVGIRPKPSHLKLPY